MNNHRLGYCRDNKVLETVEEWQVLDTNQVWMLHFPPTRYGLRKCQDRLQTLTKSGRLLRRQIAKDRPYVYMVEAREQVEHMLDINYCRLWVTRQLKSWEALWCWKYQQDFGLVVPDAVFGVRNVATNKIRFWCLEVERSNNRLTKGERYNKLFESGRKIWTAQHDNRFPGLLLAKDGRVDIKNPNGLEIKVVSLEEIRQEVMACLKTGLPQTSKLIPTT